MLMYFGAGRRDYHAHSIRGQARPNWEFQAVVAGKSSPCFGDQGGGLWRGRSLWVFPPGSSHGWASPPGKPCSILVFHFEPDDICDFLRDACQPLGYLQSDLSQSEVLHLQRLARELNRHYPVTTRLTPLLVERLRAELSWLVAHRLSHSDAMRPLNDDTVRARQALAWFSENVGQRVGVAEVAQGLGVTPGHLRKIFKSAGLLPPQRMMNDIRVGRAKNLLEHTTLSLAEIAAAVGMSGPTVFCRWFREHTGVSPRAWAAGEGEHDIGVRSE